MFFSAGKLRVDGVTAINKICELLSDDERDCLTITRGTTKITPEQQLKALYGRKYCLYSIEDIPTVALDVLDSLQLEFEKLKKRKELIEQLTNPDNYYQLTEKEDKDEKDTGIKASTDAGAEAIAIALNKSRSGNAEYSQEHDILKEWDDDDNNQLEAAKRTDKRSLLGKDWQFKEEGQGDDKKTIIDIQEKSTELIPTKPEDTEEAPVAQFLESQEQEIDKTIYLDTITGSNASSKSYSNTTNFTNMGKRINSNSRSRGVVKQYTKAKAILTQLNTEEPSIRKRILTRFRILFTDIPCQ